MESWLEALRSGAWLTRERIRLVALAVLAASVLGLGFLLATADGLNDVKGRPLGTDFANVYAAGTYVLQGEPGRPFDGRFQHAREQEIFGAKTPFYGWHYPPFFLFLAAGLATMPYLMALALWQGVTFALYLWAVWAIVAAGRSAASPSPHRGEGGWTSIEKQTPPHPPGLRPVDLSPEGRGESRAGNLWLLLALAYPAVFVNLGHGHNGFLTAALMGGALVLIERRPWMAGVLFGLLAYKPQFGLMIPLVLVLTGRWRAVAAAALTVAALAAATTLAFGTDVWTAFIDGTRFTRVVVLEQGETGWYKIQSVFSVVRMWGGTVPLAYAIQGAVTLLAAAVLGWLWRGRADFALKAAALPIASILATPYSLDYDLMVLAPSIAFLAMHGLRHGFFSYERTALAFLWFAPLIARSVAEATWIPLGVAAMLIVFGLIVARSLADADGYRPWRLLQSSMKLRS